MLLPFLCEELYYFLNKKKTNLNNWKFGWVTVGYDLTVHLKQCLGDLTEGGVYSFGGHMALQSSVVTSSHTAACVCVCVL